MKNYIANSNYGIVAIREPATAHFNVHIGKKHQRDYNLQLIVATISIDGTIKMAGQTICKVEQLRTDDDIKDALRFLIKILK